MNSDFDDFDFHRRHGVNMDKNFNMVRKGVIGIFIFVALVFILMLIGGILGIREISHHGLKGVINGVWNGTNTNQINTANSTNK